MVPTRITLDGPDRDTSDQKSLETTIASLTDTAAALSLTSSTAALHLGLVTLGVGPGDVVVLSTMSLRSAANVVRYVGATPILVDCDPATGTIDPQLLDMALRGLVNGGQQPAAVLTTNLFGSCADYTRIEAICRHYSVPIFEDATGSLGATHDGRPAGSFGVLSAVSYSGSAHVSNNGHGGALVGPRHLIERARHRSSDYPYTPSPLAEAAAFAVVNDLSKTTERTRTINARYAQILPLIPGISLLDTDRDGRGSASMTIACIDQTTRPSPDVIRRVMAEDNIETMAVCTPLHLSSTFCNAPVIGGTVSEEMLSSSLMLPSSPLLPSADQERVIASFVAALTTPPEPLSQAEVIDLNPQIELRNEQPQLRQGSLPSNQRAA